MFLYFLAYFLAGLGYHTMLDVATVLSLPICNEKTWYEYEGIIFFLYRNIDFRSRNFMEKKITTNTTRNFRKKYFNFY